MRLPDPRSRIATALIIVLAAEALVIQIGTDRPALGVFGVALLAVPGFVVSQAVGPRPLGWPQVLLTTLGTSLVLAVLTGVIVALLPVGLEASSVAAAQLAALALGAAIWLWRQARGARRPAPSPIHVRRGSLLLVGLGLALGTGGFVVASRAAQTQASVGFVQFWSVARTTGDDDALGIRNETGLALDCQVAIDRPDQPRYDLHIGAIDDGQTWLGPLPRAEGTDARPWQLSLHCAASGGSTFDRRLSIDPPT